MNHRLIPAVTLGFLALSALFPSSTRAAATAVLSVSPASGSVTVGSALSVDVLLDTGGQLVSGLTVALDYSSNLQYASFDASGSQFSTEATPVTLGPTSGHLHFTRVRFDAGYTGSGGEVIHLVFTALNSGAATVTLDQADSNVGAASGGTNILGSVANGSYTLSDPATPTPSPEATATPTPSPSSTPKPAASATPKPATLPETGSSPALALLELTAVLIPLLIGAELVRRRQASR